MIGCDRIVDRRWLIGLELELELGLQLEAVGCVASRRSGRVFSFFTKNPLARRRAKYGCGCLNIIFTLNE